jgi:hypothetical protein
MKETKLGNSVLLIGGIQFVLDLVVWLGALTWSHEGYTWFTALTESSVVLMDFGWGGAVLMILGLGMRSGKIRVDGYSRAWRAIIHAAAIFALLSLLSMILVSVPYAF